MISPLTRMRDRNRNGDRPSRRRTAVFVLAASALLASVCSYMRPSQQLKRLSRITSMKYSYHYNKVDISEFQAIAAVDAAIRSAPTTWLEYRLGAIPPEILYFGHDGGGESCLTITDLGSYNEYGFDLVCFKSSALDRIVADLRKKYKTVRELQQTAHTDAHEKKPQ